MCRASKGNKTYRLSISGKVQGVGFRPFIYRAARALGIKGTVANTASGAVIEATAGSKLLNSFLRNIKLNLPPNSEITGLRRSVIPAGNFKTFSIIESSGAGSVTADIPPDLCVCEDCAREIFSRTDRRRLYPFTNCTVCGPRFSIIKRLPYDRKYTTMRSFKMCASCESEYNDPLDRRFHAQPNACPVCGPEIALLTSGLKTQEARTPALDKAIELLSKGRIVAIKSIGGYHVACDALNVRSVKRLRKRKNRPDKPLALMMPDVNTVKKHCYVNPSELGLLTSPASPIVLLRAKKNTGLPLDIIAPENSCIGVMLPYTPLHLLLFGTPYGDKPNFEALVTTSGNRSDEPITTDENRLKGALGGIADNFLTHDRPIHNRCDDSIVLNLRPSENVFIRKSRGYVPEPVRFQPAVPSMPGIFEAGAELKNTFCLVRNSGAYVSQYIGDLDNLEASKFYEEAYASMGEFLSVKPGVVAYDLHPDYYSTRFAKKLLGGSARPEGIPVQHHHAHLASVLAEKNLHKPALGFAFDGNGLGIDGNIWGGECMLVEGPCFNRLAHLEYFHLPGGDKAVKEIWRLAASLANKYTPGLAPKNLAARRGYRAIVSMMDKNVNSPLCSSMGRLFDAVAALIGLRYEVSFEAQAAMELESLAIDNPVKKGYNFEVVFNYDGSAVPSPAVINVKPVIEGILRDISNGADKSAISARFHLTVSDIIVELAGTFGKAYGIKDVILSGGVFQNRVLTRLSIERLEREGFRVHYNTIVPPNDGGISLGQAYIAYKTVNK